MATIPSRFPVSNPSPGGLRIGPQTPQSVQRLLDEQRWKLDREWEQAISTYVGKLVEKIEGLSGDLGLIELYGLENDGEELSHVLARFKKLVLMGVRFDPRFVKRIAELCRQMRGTEHDADTDGSDDGLEDGFGERRVRANYESPNVFNLF